MDVEQANAKHYEAKEHAKHFECSISLLFAEDCLLFCRHTINKRLLVTSLGAWFFDNFSSFISSS